jgi:hypothetical protein
MDDAHGLGVVAGEQQRKTSPNLRVGLSQSNDLRPRHAKQPAIGPRDKANPARLSRERGDIAEPEAWAADKRQCRIDPRAWRMHFNMTLCDPEQSGGVIANVVKQIPLLKPQKVSSR